MPPHLPLPGYHSKEEEHRKFQVSAETLSLPDLELGVFSKYMATEPAE